MTLTMDDYEEQILFWRDLVGGFFLSFGDIEAISYRLWRKNCSGKPPIRFKDRTSKLVGELKKDNKSQELVKLLIDAMRIADKRNTVAHNPVQVQVYNHTKKGKLWDAELMIKSEINDDYIDDAELKELAAEAEDLVAALYIQIGWS